MPPDPEPTSTFGTELRSARKAAGLSLDRLADEMKGRGYKVTAANIGAWERGQHSPKSRESVAMLEDILGVTDRRLHEAMGWRPPDDPDLTEVIRDLAEQVRLLRSDLRARGSGEGAP